MEIKIKADGIVYGALASLILAILKFGGHIDWPWVWVLCPLWGSIVLTLLIFFVFVIIFFRK